MEADVRAHEELRGLPECRFSLERTGGANPDLGLSELWREVLPASVLRERGGDCDLRPVQTRQGSQKDRMTKIKITVEATILLDVHERDAERFYDVMNNRHVTMGNIIDAAVENAEHGLDLGFAVQAQLDAIGAQDLTGAKVVDISLAEDPHKNLSAKHKARLWAEGDPVITYRARQRGYRFYGDTGPVDSLSCDKCKIVFSASHSGLRAGKVGIYCPICEGRVDPTP